MFAKTSFVIFLAVMVSVSSSFVSTKKITDYLITSFRQLQREKLNRLVWPYSCSFHELLWL